jgi:hypothetical protein
MQTEKSRLGYVTNSKPKLFVITSMAIVAILAVPVILPHISHPSMIYHILIHIISLIIAVFLSSVSIIAYNRNRNARMLCMALGFTLLAVIEALYLFHTSANIQDIIIPLIDSEFSHIILLVMLSLFGMGILKVNK